MHYPEDTKYNLFSRVYQLLLRYILFFSHFFLQICIYANRSWSLWFLHINWNIRYFFADAYSPCIYYMHFVFMLLLVTNTSWNLVHIFTIRFCLNSPLVIRIVMRKANVLAFENCSRSSLSFQWNRSKDGVSSVSVPNVLKLLRTIWQYCSHD